MTKQSSFPAYQFLSLAVLLLSLFSCKKAELNTSFSGTQDVINAKSATSKPGTVSQVNLSITIGDNAGDKITSDGLGPYVNGQAGVSAYLDQYGCLQFKTNSAMSRRSGPAQRIIHFTFDDPCLECPNSGTGSAIVNDYGNYKMVTADDIKSIPIGSQVERRLGGGFASQVSSTTDWNFTFRYNQPDNMIMDDVIVSHDDDSHWTITGNVTRANGLPVAGLNNNGVLSYYYLPFHLTLTAIQ